jgi:hypothetical protein
MSQNSWEKFVNSDPGYHYDETAERFHKLWDGSWQIEGQNLQQNYSNIRDSEVQNRNLEIFHKFIGFYLSRNGIIVLVISIVLCLGTSSLSFEGLFFWNILLAIIIWGFYEMTIRMEIWPEWNEVWEELKEF